MSRFHNKCIVPFCSFKPESLHELPSDLNRRQQWLNNIFRNTEEMIEVHARAHVCNFHFEKDCYKATPRKRCLKSNAVPTLFMPPSPNNEEMSCSYTELISNYNAGISVENFEEPDSIIYSDVLINPCITVVSTPSSSTSNIEVNSTTIANKNVDAQCQVETLSKTLLQKYKKQIRTLKVAISRFKNQIMQKNKKLQELQYKIDNTEQQTILQIKKDASKYNSHAIFLLDEIRNYNKKKPRWSEITIRQCLMWRISSPKGYEYIKNFLIKLPSKSTLIRYTGSIKPGNEISELIKTRLQTEALCLSTVERVCSLIIDDMAIKEKLQYNRMEDIFYGFQTVNTTNSVSSQNTVANKMLCYVINGLSTKYTIPVAYFFHKTMAAKVFYNLTLKVLRDIKDCGFTAIRIVTDNHKSNVALFKLLGGGQLRPIITHPFYNNDIPLFLSFDYCHVIKNCRNIFLDHDIHTPNGVISSKFLKKLYDIQKGLVVKPVKYLTKKHLYPKNIEKMNVRRAIEIFSPPVTTALKYLAAHWQDTTFSECDTTIEFMEIMYAFFQLHDVSNCTRHIRQLEESCAPYVHINDERLQWLNGSLQLYINNIQHHCRKNNLEGLTNETAEALKFTAQSTSACVQYLLKDVGFYFVLTRALSSDAIESTFSVIRMRCGSQDATDARAAHHAIKRILMSGVIRSATSANVSRPFENISQTSISNICDINRMSPNCMYDLHVREMIDELKNYNCFNHTDDINSASIAFMAGYIVRTIQERIICAMCLDNISTNARTNALVDLIYLQDRGALKYPSTEFIVLIHEIIKVSLKILEYLPVDCNPRKKISKLIKSALVVNRFFICKDHKEYLVDIILEKLLKPILTNFSKMKSEDLSRDNKLTKKPISRKILKM